MEEVSVMATILSNVGTILTSLLTQMTAITTWAIGDSLVGLFIAIMFIMLAIHIIKSFVYIG